MNKSIYLTYFTKMNQLNQPKQTVQNDFANTTEQMNQQIFFFFFNWYTEIICLNEPISWNVPHKPKSTSSLHSF